ncbi:MAG TPA: hypothetical protein VL460_01700 [Caulobacteraceae bacterium]|jgi:hypothetical protein|nr:hypothetical protein [Caulobacteraceae bacterium]
MGAEFQPQVQGSGTWYVQAGGKVWGPYPEARIGAFVAEGRVAPETLMAPQAEGPFRPAARQARLHRLFGDVELAGPDGPARPQAPEAASTLPVRPLLVWAALKSQRPDRFEALLGAYGPYVRVGPGLWLVRARVGPAGLRNAMTRRLDGGDALMVLDAPLDQAAWFNLDGAVDRTLRQLWATAEG